jgi:hypothetical protein
MTPCSLLGVPIEEHNAFNFGVTVPQTCEFSNLVHTMRNTREICARSRGSVVGIATGYGLDDRGVGDRVPVGSRIFSSPRRPDRLRGPPRLLSDGYQGLFP